MATTLGGVEIPDVYVQETSRTILGGEIKRAVDGTPHTSSGRRIRTWHMETRDMPYATFRALEQMYEKAAGGQVSMHLDEWGLGAYVSVYIIEFPDERSRIPDGGTNSMRRVRIVVEEA